MHSIPGCVRTSIQCLVPSLCNYAPAQMAKTKKQVGDHAITQSGFGLSTPRGAERGGATPRQHGMQAAVRVGAEFDAAQYRTHATTVQLREAHWEHRARAVSVTVYSTETRFKCSCCWYSTFRVSHSKSCCQATCIRCSGNCQNLSTTEHVRLRQLSILSKPASAAVCHAPKTKTNTVSVHITVNFTTGTKSQSSSGGS
jgi:hypothetical protein